MRVHVVAVGRAKPGPERQLWDAYTARMAALPLGAPVLREVEAKRRADGETLKRLEADAIRAALPRPCCLTVLDERGADRSSRDWAALVTGLRDHGTRDLVFVIGGADGLHADVRDHADHRLSFGSQTWPHMLVRVLLAEQLYRAQTLIAGHPYHRD